MSSLSCLNDHKTCFCLLIYEFCITFNVVENVLYTIGPTLIKLQLSINTQTGHNQQLINSFELFLNRILVSEKLLFLQRRNMGKLIKEV